MSTRKNIWLKIFHGIIGGAIFVLLSYFFGEEYIEHQQQEIQKQASQEQLQQSLDNFSLSQIESISDISLITTPNLTWLDDIVWLIDTAEQEIFIEVYLLTEKRIPQALIRAQKRWIDIKILLEKNPYKAYNINNKNYNLLKEAGIDVLWSNPENYSLNHTKLLLIDGIGIVSTGNLSYSTFSKNRDLFLMFDDPDLYHLIREIFLADFAWNTSIPYHPNILVSPDSSRHKIQTLIHHASDSIDIYMQYLQDDQIENLLIQRASEWIQISAVLPKSYFDNKKNTSQITRLSQAWIQLSQLSDASMHAKAILVDQTYLYIWSINMSHYSFDHNREIWILLGDSHIIQSFLQQYSQDLKRGLQKQK